MVDQDTYNNEHDELINNSKKKGIRLLKNPLEIPDIEIPDAPLFIDMKDAELKSNKDVKIIVKEFKIKKKTDDEPIW